MCRLYGFLSNWPRKVECELVHSQNALLAQSLSDERGLNNPDGWGLGAYTDGYPMVTKQAAPAYESEAFRWTAAQVVSTDVLAHVRKATVGRPELLNTHPFSYGCWMLVHNGNLGAFQAIRQRIIDFIGPHHAAAIEGRTDSEHVFHLLLASMERYPDRPTMEILRTGIQLVRSWSRSADPTAEVALNLMLTNVYSCIPLFYSDF